MLYLPLTTTLLPPPAPIMPSERAVVYVAVLNCRANALTMMSRRVRSSRIKRGLVHHVTTKVDAPWLRSAAEAAVCFGTASPDLFRNVRAKFADRAPRTAAVHDLELPEEVAGTVGSLLRIADQQRRRQLRHVTDTEEEEDREEDREEVGEKAGEDREAANSDVEVEITVAGDGDNVAV